MSVYLGDSGGVSIRRQGEPVKTMLDPSNVDVALKRVSFDFDPSYAGTRPNVLITGDEVQFSSTDESNFELVDGLVAASVTRWVHVDMTGGIRLYSTFEAAYQGGREGAETLVEPPSDGIEITVDVVNAYYECVAQIRSWELTTQRETVDTSILGEEYRQFYDQGMVSGQGSIDAIWDYKFTACKDTFDLKAELANYFAQLVIRFREGSRFLGMFTIFCSDAEAVWYECECICTSVGMNFAPGQVIGSTIQFITTGQIRLLRGTPPSYLLLDVPTTATDRILLEQNLGRIELEFSE